MTATSRHEDDSTIDERLEAYHEALLAREVPPVAAGDASLVGAHQCLLLFERVRKQAGPQNSDRLFGTSCEDTNADSTSSAVTSEVSRQSPLEWESSPSQIGRFQIERRIGEGGFGVVFLARDPHLDRRVALKLPRPELLISQSWRSRFLREAEAAALLEHPQIIPVFEAGQAGSLCYIVQAWCDGVSLDRWLATRLAPVRPRAAARLIAALADAVQHAHSRGVLHRDIKPANILLETSGPAEPSHLADEDLARVAHLSDFGLARIADQEERQTLSGAILGTPAYMSPEQAEGRSAAITVAADIYALGAVMYELLTQRSPFEGPSVLATLEAVRSCEPVPLRRHNAAVPLDLEAICLKCLEKDPARRYSTAQDLATDLRRFLAGEVVVARAVSSAERIVRWCRCRPALASLSGIILLLTACLIGGLGTATWLLDQSRQSALLASQRAERNERRAIRIAYDAHLAEARAVRRSGDAGQRWESLAAIGRAAELLPQLNLPAEQRSLLRQEAIEALKLIDLEPQESWPLDEEQLATVSADGALEQYAYFDRHAHSLVVRRFLHNTTLQSLPVPPQCDGVSEIRFSPDGTYLAARLVERGNRAAVQVWKLATGEASTRIDATPIRGCPHDFSPDGKRLAVALADGRVGIFELPSFLQIHTWSDKRPASTVRFDHTSKRLAVYRTGQMELLDVATGKLAYKTGCNSHANQLDISPDGTMVGAACDDKVIRLWGPRSGNLHPLIMADDEEVTRLRFGPKGHIIAASTRHGTTRLWMTSNLQPLLRASGWLTEFSPDGKLIGLGSSRQRIISVEHRLVSMQPAAGPTNTAAERLSIDETGRLLAVSNPDQFALIDLVEAKLVANAPTLGGRAQFDPTGKTIFAATATGLHRLGLRRLEDATQIGCTFTSPKLVDRTPGMVDMAASSDGRRVVGITDSSPASVVVIDVSAKETRVLEPHHEGARWLAISASGRWLATATWQGKDILVWDAETGQLVTRLESSSARVAFSPDESTLIVDEGRRWMAYRTADWQPAAPPQLRNPSSDFPGPIAFSNDSCLLAIRGIARQIQVRDAHTLDLLLTLEVAYLRNVESILFDGSGTRLIGGTAAPGLINIWDLRALRNQLTAIGLGLPGKIPAPDAAPENTKPLHARLDFSILTSAPEPTVSQVVEETLR